MWKTTQCVTTMSVLFGLIALLGCREESTKVKPQFQEISEAVYASVTVQPMQLYSVYPVQPGIIEQLLIEEGDRVAREQVLARMRTIDPELNLENAKLRFKLAADEFQGRMNALDAMKEEIALMEVQVEVDSQNYARQTRLWEQNIGSKAALETAELTHRKSVKSLEVLHSQYEQKSRELQSAYEQARVSLKQAEANLKDFTVASRLDGCVYEVLKEEGERIALQEPMAHIGLCDSFVMEMLVDEVDIASVLPGQLVVVTLDAYPDKAFEAQVTRIYPSKDLQTQTFTVEADFKVPPPVLYAGLGGEANIVITTRGNALTIPIEYLKDDDRVVTQNGEVKVKTGLRSLAYIEILSGIDSSTVILKPEHP